MYKRAAVLVLFASASVALIASVLYAQEAPARSRRPSPAIPVAAQPGAPATPAPRVRPAPPEVAPGKPRSNEQRTRVQIEVLQLQCPRADLAKINTSELAAGSTAQAMETLKKLGPVTQAHRIDIPVLFNTGSEASIRCGARVPVVRDITVGGGGKVTPSVDYQDTGASVELNGAWVEENGGTRAEAFVAVEWSSLGSSSVSVAEGVKLPTFGQYKFKQPLQCISGESVVYVINQSGNPGDDKADTTVGVVRVTMTQLGR